MPARPHSFFAPKVMGNMESYYIGLIRHKGILEGLAHIVKWVKPIHLYTNFSSLVLIELSVLLLKEMSKFSKAIEVHYCYVCAGMHSQKWLQAA